MCVWLQDWPEKLGKKQKTCLAETNQNPVFQFNKGITALVIFFLWRKTVKKLVIKRGLVHETVVVHQLVVFGLKQCAHLEKYFSQCSPRSLLQGSTGVQDDLDVT